MSSPGDIDDLLHQLSSASAEAQDQSSQQLFALIYDELYKLAQDRLRHERTGHTLQPTALVNEVYLRLVSADAQKQWDSAAHFFGAAARAMRQILIDNARRKLALKRTAEGGRVDLQVDMSVDNSSCIFNESSLVELHEAMLELEKEDALKARLVELRFFAGLSIEQICEVLHISRATAHRHWKQARAILFLKISGELN